MASGPEQQQQQQPQQQRPRGLRLPSSTAGPRVAYVTHFNPDTQAFIRRRVRLPDQDAIAQLRIPGPPLPASWGRAVQPLAAPGAAAGSAVFTAPDLAAFPYQTLPQQQFLAVLINRGWRQQPCRSAAGGHPQERQRAGWAAGPPAAAGSSRGAGSRASQRGGGGGGLPCAQQQQPPASGGGAEAGVAGAAAEEDPVTSAVRRRLGLLPLQQLVPRGFVFIWLCKEDISAVVKCFAEAGYVYVENLTWVLMAANHTVLRLPAPFVRQSHLSLYIFRREGEGRDIELRHQRNPDVVFDCVCTPDGRNWRTPPEVFSIIETLLPTGMSSFLELWAPHGTSRAGWTHLAEGQPPDSVQQQQQEQEQHRAPVDLVLSS